MMVWSRRCTHLVTVVLVLSCCSPTGFLQPAIASFVGSVVLPNLRSRISVLAKLPFESIRVTQPMFKMGFLDASATPGATRELRQWFYNLALSSGTGGDGAAQTMVYMGMEDGRFLGYFAPGGERAYTYRASSGLAADIDWVGYGDNLTAVNECVLRGSCKDYLGKSVAVSCPSGTRMSSGDCTETCCDANIRNYYRTSIATAGAPLAVTAWKTYDPRGRPWYKSQKAAWLASKTVKTGWSDIYEFSTSKAVGVTATGAAVRYNSSANSTELLGVVAVDYELGAINLFINDSLAGAPEGITWAYIVERANGKLLGISTADKLYDTSRPGLFLEQRLSATNASSYISAAAASAQWLEARGWPSGYHREGIANTGWEMQSDVFTGPNGQLDWLLVVGQTISCGSRERWRSLAGRCEACPGGQNPLGWECGPCDSESAGSDGSCTVCPDGTEPNVDQTACISCRPGRAGVRGKCARCLPGMEVNSNRTSCGCPDGTYDSHKCGLIACFDREHSAEGILPVATTEMKMGYACIPCPSCVKCSGGYSPPVIRSGYSLSPVGTRIWKDGLQTNTSSLIRNSALLLAAANDLPAVSHDLYNLAAVFEQQANARAATCAERACASRADHHSFGDGYCDYDDTIGGCVPAMHSRSLNISLFKCPTFPGGAGTTCAGAPARIVAVNNSQPELSNSSANKQCSGNHTGTLCGECITTHEFRGGFTKPCEACEENEYLKLGLTIAGLGLVAIAGYFVYRWLAKQGSNLESVKMRYLVLRKVWHAKNVLGMGTADTDIEKDSKRAPLMDTMKIMVGNLQIIGKLPMTFRASFIHHLPLSADFFDLLKYLDMDMWGFLPLDCIFPQSLYGTFFATVLTPVVLCIIILTKHRMKWVGKEFDAGSRDGLTRTHSFRALASAKKVAANLREKAKTEQGTAANQQCMLVIFFFYPSVSSIIFRTLQCRELDFGLSVHQYDHSIDCNASRYQIMRLIAVVLLVLMPIGIPVFFGTIMYWNRERLTANTDDDITFEAFVEIASSIYNGPLTEGALRAIFDDVDDNASDSVSPSEIYEYAFRSEITRRLKADGKKQGDASTGQQLKPLTFSNLFSSVQQLKDAEGLTINAEGLTDDKVQEMIDNQHDEWRSVHVGDLPQSHANEAALTYLFSDYGKVASVSVKKRPDSTSWALVTFNNMKTVELLTQDNPAPVEVMEGAQPHVLKIAPLDYERLCNSVGQDAMSVWESQREKCVEKVKKQWWYGGKTDFSFLVKSYKPQLWYFELTIFLKKFVLAGVLVFADPGSITQLYLGLFISFWFLTVLVHTMPYKIPKTMTIALVAEVNLFFTILFVLMLKLDLHGEWLTQYFFDLNLVCFNSVTAVVPCLLGVVYSVIRFARLWADSKNVIKQGDMVEILSMPDRHMYETNIGKVVSEVPIPCTDTTELEIELPSKIHKHPWKRDAPVNWATIRASVVKSAPVEEGDAPSKQLDGDGVSSPEPACRSPDKAKPVSTHEKKNCQVCRRRQIETLKTEPEMVTVTMERKQVRHMVKRSQIFAAVCKMVVHLCRLGRALLVVDNQQTDIESQKHKTSAEAQATTGINTNDAATSTAMARALRPVLEPPLTDRFGVHWSAVEPLLRKLLNPDQLDKVLEDPKEFLMTIVNNPVIRRLIIDKLKPVLEPVMEIYGLTWHISYIVLDAVLDFERIEAIVADPPTVFKRLLEKGGPICIVLIGMLQAKLEPIIVQEQMTWVLVAGALESLATVEMLLMGLEFPNKLYKGLASKLKSLRGVGKEKDEALVLSTEEKAACDRGATTTEGLQPRAPPKPSGEIQLAIFDRHRLIPPTSPKQGWMPPGSGSAPAVGESGGSGMQQLPGGVPGKPAM